MVRSQPIAFAHRGASDRAPGNSLEAFRLALALGATGLEADAWATADGVAVLDHDGRVRIGLRRRALRELERRDLPETIPSLEDLYEACGTGFELSVDVKDPEAVDAVVSAARAAGGGAPGRLWLCHPDLGVLAEWRTRFDDVRLVNSTSLRHAQPGPERRAAKLAEVGVDAVNAHHTEWTGGHVALFHRFERLAFAWDAQHTRIVRALARMGVDGVYGDHVDRLVEGLAATAGDVAGGRLEG